MVCPTCNHENVMRHGKDRHGHQRYRCRQCKKTFCEDRPRPLGNMYLPVEKAVKCLQLLLDGISIRACERFMGVNRDTLCDLILNVGEQCRHFLNAKLSGVPVGDVQCDEVWSWVGMKEKTKIIQNRTDYTTGDAYAYIGIERNS